MDPVFLNEHFKSILGSCIDKFNASQKGQFKRDYWNKMFQEYLWKKLAERIQRQLKDSSWTPPDFELLCKDDQWPKGGLLFVYIHIHFVYTICIYYIIYSPSLLIMNSCWKVYE
jgi:hypothetical protein